MSTDVHTVRSTTYTDILQKLREYHQAERCRDCECLQGALVQLRFAASGGMDAEINNLLVGHGRMHSCLGCDPCPPAEALVAYFADID